jgi:hypothetical protein
MSSTQDDLTIRNGTANTLTSLRVMPNGTVTNFPSAFAFYGTDRVADPNNYERMFIYAKGTGDTNYIIGTDAAGTGIRRPLLLTADGSSTQLLLSATGNVSVGTSITGPGTVPAGGTAGQELIKNSGANYDTIWSTASGVTLQSAQANPGATTSTTGVMAGLAQTITPARSGKIVIFIAGNGYNNTAADGYSCQIRYGTGTAPANGAAPVGTAIGATAQGHSAASGYRSSFCLTALVTGLTVGTAVWIDLLEAAVTGGTMQLQQVTVTAWELP